MAKTAQPQARIDDPKAAQMLLNPTRSRILTSLRSPRSATEVARELGISPALAHHHMNKLLEVALVRRAGSRRVRNLVEHLYVALARTFLIDAALTPGGDLRSTVRSETGRRSLRNLVAVGERLEGDALTLLDDAASENREISTFATTVDLEFPDARARGAFLADLLESVRRLKEKYGAQDVRVAERYKTIIACYPDSRGNGNGSEA